MLNLSCTLLVDHFVFCKYKMHLPLQLSVLIYFIVLSYTLFFCWRLIKYTRGIETSLIITDKTIDDFNQKGVLLFASRWAKIFQENSISRKIIKRFKKKYCHIGKVWLAIVFHMENYRWNFHFLQWLTILWYFVMWRFMY
jgi:hypothetical protein